MKKQLIRKITAAAMAFAMIGAAVSAPTDKSSLSGSIFTAFAETSTATFDESTGVLTLHGNVVKEDVRYWQGVPIDKVVCAEGTVFPEDGSNMFYDCRTKEFDLSNADTSKVTDMSHMFDWCHAESLDLRNFDTSKVTDMSFMFERCQFLDSLDLSSFDTSKVTNMSHMFDCCYSLESLDLRNFDTSKVTDMSHMFDCCHAESLDLRNFDTSKVTDMSDMFSGCQAESLDLRNFDTSNVTDMSFMFYDCEKLESLNLSSFDTSNVTYMSFMFRGCPVESLDLRNFDTSNVTYMNGMFEGCHVESLDLSSFDTSNVTDMHWMFHDCYAKSLDLSSFDTSNVTDMRGMFFSCPVESLDLSSFDTSNVTAMGWMFEDCSNLESLDLRNFDTSNVTEMGYMFADCSSLKSLDVTSFDTSKVSYIQNMFAGCSSLEYIDVTGFDTTKSSDYNESYLGMFYTCTALEPSICFVEGNSVTLDGNIGVNVYLQPCENLAKVVMSGPNGDRTFTDFTGITQDSGDYKFTYPINATQGNEQITLKAYDKDGKRLIICDNNYGLCNHSQVECTVYGYIDQIKKYGLYEAPPTLEPLVNGLENYCKAAENYFNGTSNTIAGIENVTADSVSEYATDLGSDVKLSLVLNSTTALRIYTNSDDVIIGKEKAAAKYKGSNKYYEISNIYAQNLFDKHKIKIDGVEYEISPMSYVYRVLTNENASDKLKDVAKATFVYAKAAAEYTGKK